MLETLVFCLSQVLQGIQQRIDCANRSSSRVYSQWGIQTGSYIDPIAIYVGLQQPRSIHTMPL